MNIYTVLERHEKDIGEHIISKLDLPDIVKILSDELSGSELNTILLEVLTGASSKKRPRLY